jgi:asparagine synthase (glutamine-hydrolysing)
MIIVSSLATRVEPGHLVTITPTGVRARRYWNYEPRMLEFKTTEAYVEALRHHLDQAVQSQLHGINGRVAAHLSGGFDSAAVATTAARLLALSGGKVTAFTSVPRADYNLPVPKRRLGDEGSLAAVTAAMHGNIDHVLVRTHHQSPLEALDSHFFLCERPVLNLCNSVWDSAIADQVRSRKLRVLLAGQAGNMTFSYDGSEMLAELMRNGRWLKWVRAVRPRYAPGAGLRGALAATFTPWLSPRLWQLLCRFYYGESYDIREYSAINPTMVDELDLAAVARAHGLDLSYRARKARRDGIG